MSSQLDDILEKRKQLRARIAMERMELEANWADCQGPLRVVGSLQPLLNAFHPKPRPWNFLRFSGWGGKPLAWTAVSFGAKGAWKLFRFFKQRKQRRRAHVH